MIRFTIRLAAIGIICTTTVGLSAQQRMTVPTVNHEELVEIRRAKPSARMPFTAELYQRMIDEADFWLFYGEKPVDAMKKFPKSVLERVDTNRSGLVNGDREIRALRSEYKRWLLDMIENFDTNKDGKISGEELKAATDGLAEYKQFDKEKARVEAEIQKFDTSGDGYIDREEFQDWCKQHAKIQEEKERLRKQMETVVFWSRDPGENDKLEKIRWDKQVLERYDQNNDGTLSAKEEETRKQEMTFARARIVEYDKDKSGTLDENELNAAIEDMKKKAIARLEGLVKQIEPLFEQFDENKNSLLEPFEFFRLGKAADRKLAEIFKGK